MRRLTVYQDFEPAYEVCARNLARAKRCEMRGVHLAIDQSESPTVELPYEMCQRDLRGIGGAREHGFAVEHASQRYTVASAAAFAVDPGFHGMCATAPIQRRVRTDHVVGDPRAIVSLA